MTFTYAGDPAHSPKDLIRFLISDTDEHDQIFSDEEITWHLGEHPDPYETAWRLCELAAANAGRMVDTTSGEIKVMLSQRQAQLLETAKTLRAQSAMRAQTPRLV